MQIKSIKYYTALIGLVLVSYNFPLMANNLVNKQLIQPVHAISIFGQPKYQNGFKNFAYVNPQAPKGGQVKLAAVGTFDNLNPFILKGVSAAGTEMTFDTLTISPADEPDSAYGLIAESIEMPNTREWIAFNLRSIARWQDGAKITADDVVFSFNTLIKEGHPQYKMYYQDVKGVEKISDSKVKFTFNNTQNKELPIIIGNLPIISKKYYSTHKFDQTTLQAPMGSGPYKVKALQAGRYIEYELDKNYWGRNLPVNKGRNNFAIIRYDYYRDDTVAVEALKAGEYDFRRENIAKTWATSYNNLAVKEHKMIKEELFDGTPTGMQCFAFNIRKDKFNNLLVREAFNYAYDFEWSNKTLFYNAYQRNKSFFGNSEYASSGKITSAELKLLEPYKNILPPRVFTDVYNPPFSDGSGDNRENLLKAQKLLDQAGWKIKDMHRIDPSTGKPATVEFLLNSQAFERVAAAYARNLKKLGIDSTIRTVDISQYIKRQETFDFDIIVQWYTQGIMPGIEEYNYWHSSMAEQNGSLNLVGIKNPVVDILIDKIIKSSSKEDLKTAAYALDRVLLWNFYVVPQWHSRTHRLIYWNKFGRPAIVPPYNLAFIDTWWVK